MVNRFRSAYPVEEVQISSRSVREYIDEFEKVAQTITRALEAQDLINELTGAKQLRSQERRTSVGVHTDLVGQWPPDTFATALSVVALAVFGGGTAILGVSEYLHLGNWIAFAPVFWFVALFFYAWSLKRERQNTNRRLKFFKAVLQSHAPELVSDSDWE